MCNLQKPLILLSLGLTFKHVSNVLNVVFLIPLQVILPLEHMMGFLQMLSNIGLPFIAIVWQMFSNGQDLIGTHQYCSTTRRLLCAKVVYKILTIHWPLMFDRSYRKTMKRICYWSQLKKFSRFVDLNIYIYIYIYIPINNTTTMYTVESKQINIKPRIYEHFEALVSPSCTSNLYLISMDVFKQYQYLCLTTKTPLKVKNI